MLMMTCNNGLMFFQMILVEVCYEHLPNLHYNSFCKIVMQYNCNAIQLLKNSTNSAVTSFKSRF